jgi:hypothetical protein
LFATYALISRWVRRRVRTPLKQIERWIGAGQTERAMRELESLRSVARWQPFLTSTLEAQIGMLRYAHMRDFDRSVPHLRRASRFSWQAKVMLAACHFRKKQHAESGALVTQGGAGLDRLCRV